MPVIQRRGMSNAEARLQQLRGWTENIKEFLAQLEEEKKGRHEQSIVEQLLGGKPVTGNRPDAGTGILKKMFSPNSYSGMMTDMERDYKLQPVIQAIQEGQLRKKQKADQEMETFKTDEQIRLEEKKSELKPAPEPKQVDAVKEEESRIIKKVNAWKNAKPPEAVEMPTDEEFAIYRQTMGVGEKAETRSTWEQIQAKKAAGLDLTPGEQELFDKNKPEKINLRVQKAEKKLRALSDSLKNMMNPVTNKPWAKGKEGEAAYEAKLKEYQDAEREYFKALDDEAGTGQVEAEVKVEGEGAGNQGAVKYTKEQLMAPPFNMTKAEADAYLAGQDPDYDLK